MKMFKAGDRVSFVAHKGRVVVVGTVEKVMKVTILVQEDDWNGMPGRRYRVAPNVLKKLS